MSEGGKQRRKSGCKCHTVCVCDLVRVLTILSSQRKESDYFTGETEREDTQYTASRGEDTSTLIATLHTHNHTHTSPDPETHKREAALETDARHMHSDIETLFPL